MTKPTIPDFSGKPTERRRIKLDDLTTRTTQQRVRTDQATVGRYAERYAADGLKALPPVTVIWSKSGAEEKLYLADGHHRVAAARKAGFQQIECDIFIGDKRDLVLIAAQRNAAHGLPLSPEDKRALVATLLADPEWRAWSDREIARQLHVSADLVGKVRPTVEGAQSDKRKGADGRTIAKRGTSAKAQAAAPVTPPPAPVVTPAPEPAPAAREPEEITLSSPSVVPPAPVPAPAPIASTSNLATRRLVRMRHLVADQLRRCPPIQADLSQTCLMALIVGVNSVEGLIWCDANLSYAFERLADSVATEIADALCDGDSDRLPDLATICRFWEIDHDAIRIIAERTITE